MAGTAIDGPSKRTPGYRNDARAAGDHGLAAVEAELGDSIVVTATEVATNHRVGFRGKEGGPANIRTGGRGGERKTHSPAGHGPTIDAAPRPIGVPSALHKGKMRAMRISYRLAPLILVAFVPALGAQGEVRGVLFDSLRAGAPIANAIVTVDGRPERTRTDGRGRFRFASLPVGVYTVRYQAPWLDSLGLPSLTGRAEVISAGAGPVAELVTPTIGTLQRALCGTTLPPDAGILRGELRDARSNAAAGIFVGAVWAQATIARSGVSNELIGTVDTTDSAGAFALCGVPTGSTFLLRAGDDSFGTGELVIDIGEVPMRFMELVVGPSAGSTSAVGRVTGGRDRVLSNATVSVPGDTILGARVGADGRFVVNALPPRSTQLFIRAIGFMPKYQLMNGAADALELGDVALTPVAQELAERRITARATSLEQLEFRQRQETGLGIFLDEERLARYPTISATSLANESITIRTTGGRYPRTQLRRGADTCLPRFFLDGVDWGIPRDGVEEGVIIRNAVRIEVYEAAFMPARYTDFNGCGVVLVWTR